MIDFSNDPRESEKQIQAIITYLVVFGYIDGDFDRSEKEFIREYIGQIVDRKLEQGDAYRALPPPALKQLRTEQIEHYNQVFESLDEQIQEDMTESVTKEESSKAYVRHRLKLRCFEIFRSFEPENRNALMDVIDEFIMADGVSHPAEVEFRNELADLLNLEPMLDMDDLEVIASSLQITEEVKLQHAEKNNPFMRNLERHYSKDPEERAVQAHEEMAAVQRELALLEKLRAAGRGKLSTAQKFSELMNGDEFLDGYVYVIPPKPGRSYEITVLGDLHGCYTCLKAALLQADFFNKVEAFRRDPEHTPEPKVVLLGDYNDRGKFSYQGILRAVMELHQKYPEHIYPLRGNHEYYIEYEGRIYGGVLPAEAINTARDYLPRDFFVTYMKFFEEIPTVAVFDRIFFVHAGIPKDSVLEDWPNLARLNEPEVRFQMLWSDPSEADIIPKSLQEESARFPFGTLQFASFMASVGCNVMIRGHTKVVQGFKTVLDDGNNKLLNLFSAGGKNNDDLPVGSSYRAVTPKALTITWQDGEMTASPWTIDYEDFNQAMYNRFASGEPAFDLEESGK